MVNLLFDTRPNAYQSVLIDVMQDENRLQKDLNEHLNRIELLPDFSNHFMLNGVRRNTWLYMNFSNTEIMPQFVNASTKCTVKISIFSPI